MVQGGFGYIFWLSKLLSHCSIELIMLYLFHRLQAPDAGLLTPDLVVYLDISPEVNYAFSQILSILSYNMIRKPAIHL